jgi:type I restriction enzyme R subunit
MSDNLDSEAALERESIALLRQLGWQTINAYDETFALRHASRQDAGPSGTLGREHRGEVVLLPRLRAALTQLNPGLPAEALALAVEELTRDRSAMSLVQANRQIYAALKEGLKVAYRDEDNEEQVATVRLIDWHRPNNNDFLLVSQLWVAGDIYTRRTDLVGFVNGLPLLFIELKASHRRLVNAFRRNFHDYQQTIPHLFWTNSLVILSNGRESRVGSVSAEWEHFGEWKRINDEGETGVISLETTLRAICPPTRLLDLVENFTVFAETKGGVKKLVAKNHQYLGVNRAIAEVKNLKENQGRLGVFWHTQGSGKSYSMIFFAQKVLRTQPGNWTFLIVTDRQELDKQIYQTFSRAGVVTEPEKSVRAQSGEHLQQLLREDHRYLFTLIQKFGYVGRGEWPLAPTPLAPTPALTGRPDIIVIVDEAHRSQYDTLALNMRNALPNAAFIAYTGTPLMAGEERTREVFGDYVSIYNFKQSVDDQATVPMFYENRIPELQLINDDFNADMNTVLEEAELDEAQEQKLEREFAREYHLITRDERLEKIAEDIVDHFIGRGYKGKAMVVSIDKLSAVRVYDKVRQHWQQRLAGLQGRLAACDELERPELEAQVEFMTTTDMAVVISQEQNEIDKFRQKGLEIESHRRRMVTEDLETKFKDPDDPFRLVFVCAMWMTGFDAPDCSTIYLDKPMRNHTLMQTIARANRVFGQKNNGLIVDYIGVFRDLQRALAIYGSAYGGGIQEGERPVKDKQALLEALAEAIGEVAGFCQDLGVDLHQILVTTSVFQRLALEEEALNALLVNDEAKQTFLTLVSNVDRIYRAILPDPLASQYQPLRSLLVVLATKIRSLAPEVDIGGVMGEVESLLDRSIAPQGYVIRPGIAETRAEYTVGAIGQSPLQNPYLVDLSQIDLEALKAHFKNSQQRIEIEKLRGAINSKLQQMVRLNRQRMDYLEQFQQMIEEYNAGSRNAEEFFTELIEFTHRLTSEEKRHLVENLNEEELAVFDLLIGKPPIKLTAKERKQVKQAARKLLEALKAEKLTLDWRKRQQARAAVKVAIDEILDQQLPNVYTSEVYQQRCEAVYQHVYESYFGAGRSIYSMPLAV